MLVPPWITKSRPKEVSSCRLWVCACECLCVFLCVRQRLIQSSSAFYIIINIVDYYYYFEAASPTEWSPLIKLLDSNSVPQQFPGATVPSGSVASHELTVVRLT